MVKLSRRDTQSSSQKRIRNTKALGIQEAEAERPVQSICWMERKQKEIHQKENEATHVLGNSKSKREVDLSWIYTNPFLPCSILDHNKKGTLNVRMVK